MQKKTQSTKIYSRIWTLVLSDFFFFPVPAAANGNKPRDTVTVPLANTHSGAAAPAPHPPATPPSSSSSQENRGKNTAEIYFETEELQGTAWAPRRHWGSHWQSVHSTEQQGAQSSTQLGAQPAAQPRSLCSSKWVYASPYQILFLPPLPVEKYPAGCSSVMKPY